MSEPLDYFEEEHKPKEELHIGLKILAFLIPLAGLIMYFSFKSASPQKSQSACTASLWGIGVGFVIRVFTGLAAGGL